MEWGIGLIAVAAGLVVYAVFLNSAPPRCPCCGKVNVLRRQRTGERQATRDDEGDVRQSAAEFACGLCGGRYWAVWDDVTGRSAVPASPEPEPPV